MSDPPAQKDTQTLDRRSRGTNTGRLRPSAMWLGYASSLLFVISYHWHPPLHIHIYTCQIWHLYPPGGDQVLSHLLVSPTVPIHYEREMSSPFKTFLLRSQSQTGRPFAWSLSSLCSPVRDGDQTMDHFHDMWESLLFRWLPGRQPLPSLLFPLFTAFGSINMGAHLMWSPPSD